MPNGSELLDAIDFEDKLGNLQGDELSRFIARQLYEHCEQSSIRDNRIQALENKSTRFTGVVAGFASVLGGVIVGAADFLLKK